jgi:trk system potassium uptake protein TrkA
MNFIVIGCGRVGAELAYRLYRSGHQVVVVDNNIESFNRLNPAFRGRIVEGEALSEKVLERADIANADGVAAVTNLDTLNAVVAHIAQTLYNVQTVVVRNYNPKLRTMLEAFGLQNVSSTSWGAQRVEEMLSIPAFRTVFSAGNGEVEVYEVLIPPTWDGHTLDDLLSGNDVCLPVALTRAGRSMIPTSDLRLQTGDVLDISTTYEGISALKACLLKEAED